MKKNGLMAAIALLALACFSSAAQAEGGIEITNAWARPTVEGGMRNGAIYLTLKNNGKEEDKLIGASFKGARIVGIHETINKNGIMQMHERTSIPLPPGETVAFEPGGKHIMLMAIVVPLEAGKRYPFTLVFKNAGKIATEFEVKAD